jgi:carbamoyltransferase
MNQPWILGLNAVGFNTSSVLLRGNEIFSAVEEERLIRQKRTRRFPFSGINFHLNKAGIRLSDLHAIAIGWNPLINLESHNTAQSERQRYLGEMLYSIPSSLMSLQKSTAADTSSQHISLEDGSILPIHYVRHHLCHASNFYSSPYDEAAILTVDAFGEKESITFSIGQDTKIDTIWRQEFPHSLGCLYSTLTEFLGFEAQGDEWKLMGASSYGHPEKFRNRLSTVVKLIESGGFELDLSYFNFYQFHRPGRYTKKLAELLGVQPNQPGKALNQEYYDLASAAQELFEKIYFHLLTQLQKKTGLKNVVLSGGCALNSLANGKILSKTNFIDCFIPPVPDDSGVALGAAYYVYHRDYGGVRCESMKSNYFGPSFTNIEIIDYLKKYKIKHRNVENPAKEAATLIASGKVIGWFQGAVEFGDRALGNRSILADPRDAAMKEKVNDTVKYREGFRPFAPSILEEKISEYFIEAVPTPFMEKVFLIREDKRKIIPAVTHVDGTGRIQTVTKTQNKLYWELISEFEKMTGIPIVLNTSFNLKGEPIVCEPTDAIKTFFSSGLDALVIGSSILEK